VPSTCAPGRTWTVPQTETTLPATRPPGCTVTGPASVTTSPRTVPKTSSGPRRRMTSSVVLPAGTTTAVPRTLGALACGADAGAAAAWARDASGEVTTDPSSADPTASQRRSRRIRYSGRRAVAAAARNPSVAPASVTRNAATASITSPGSAALPPDRTARRRASRAPRARRAARARGPGRRGRRGRRCGRPPRGSRPRARRPPTRRRCPPGAGARRGRDEPPGGVAEGDVPGSKTCTSSSPDRRSAGAGRSAANGRARRDQLGRLELRRALRAAPHVRPQGATPKPPSPSSSRSNSSGSRWRST
jgi:hypothetical protein